MPRMITPPIVLTQVNHYEVTGIHIYLKPAPRCLIEVQRSYLDGEAVTPVDTLTHSVEGAPFIAEMTAPTTGASMYDELKARVYARCIADGIIPSDAVEI